MKLLEFLQEKAEGEIFEGDDVSSASGGNFDDAYEMGVEDGEILMAQEIIDKLKSGELTLE